MIDLHCHTTCSDGTKTPIELLQMAEKVKLTHFSITDHNNVKAYFEIGDKEKYFSGKLITGVELRCGYYGKIFELLAYDFDLKIMQRELDKLFADGSDDEKLQRFCEEKMADACIRGGIKFSTPDIVKQWDRNKYFYLGCHLHADMKQYEENKKIITDEKSWNDSIAFFRNHINNPDGPCYLDFSAAFPSVKQIVDIIKKAGGKIFVPHIFVYGDKSNIMLESVVRDFPIDGIECYYHSFSKEQTEYLLKFCKKHKLAISAGSDFHGKAGYPDNVGTVLSAEQSGWLS